MAESETVRIRQHIVTRLIGTREGGVARLNDPNITAGPLPPPSPYESVWRTFDTPNNRIIVTQLGEQVLKANVTSPETLETLAHALHKIMQEGRELSPDDPFEYVRIQSPHRERVGSGAESIVYRIKGTDIVVKIRIHHYMTSEADLERTEAIRMALQMRQARGEAMGIEVVPILFTVFPHTISEATPGAQVTPLTEATSFTFMPYIEGVTAASATEAATTQQEKDAIRAAFTTRAKTLQVVIDDISRSIYPRDENRQASLDLVPQNAIIRPNGDYAFFDLPI